MRTLIIVPMILGLACCCLCSGEVLTVTNTNDSGDGSLRWAVAQANLLPGADTIVFDPGVFVPGTMIWMSSGQLSLLDTTGKTTIDGHGASVTITGINLSRIFLVGVGVTAEISGLTVTEGHAIYDGSDYKTGNGGAISNFGDLTISGCILSNNIADREGGGIENNSGGRLTVNSSTLSRNSAMFGGGIGSRGNLTVSFSNVSYNSVTPISGGSSNNGGGIGNAAAVLVISVSTISHNSAANGTGGGIYNSGTLIVTASTLAYNSAGFGGGIANVGDVTTVSESTLSGNSATGFLGGGAIYGGYGRLTVSDSTVAYNSAPSGGGIEGDSPTPSILHNVLVGGNFLYNSNPRSPSDLSGMFDPSSSYNLIGDGSGGFNASTGNLLGTPSSPLDPKLGALQNNGGPTWTHALLAGSPAINTGDPAILPAPDLYDQRGTSFARVVGGRIDIGSFEVQALTSQEHLTDVADYVFILERKLPPGVVTSLKARVEVARELLDRGNTTPVVKMLEAFIQQVHGLRTAGKLTDAEAQFLIEAARRAINSVKL